MTFSAHFSVFVTFRLRRRWGRAEQREGSLLPRTHGASGLRQVARPGRADPVLQTWVWIQRTEVRVHSRLVSVEAEILTLVSLWWELGCWNMSLSSGGHSLTSILSVCLSGSLFLSRKLASLFLPGQV